MKCDEFIRCAPSRTQREPKGRDEEEQVAEDGGERAGRMLPLLPVSNSICQLPIGDWQHFHIGNILKTPRQPMRQTVGRDRRARRNEAPTQHHRRIIADGSGSRPYRAALPRWYFHFAIDLPLIRLIAVSPRPYTGVSCLRRRFITSFFNAATRSTRMASFVEAR